MYNFLFSAFIEANLCSPQTSSHILKHHLFSESKRPLSWFVLSFVLIMHGLEFCLQIHSNGAKYGIIIQDK